MVVAHAALFSFIALTSVQPANARQCDILISEIVQSTDAEFVRFSPSGKNAFLAHPYMDSFTVECSAPSRPLISAYWSRNAFPPNQFFAAIAVAAERVVTSERADRIEAGLRHCSRTALRQRGSEMASIMVGAARIGCHSFTRDGGSVGLSISKGR